MQGVRTTRGCTNCRSRKKGCDFQRPKCGKCQLLNIHCVYEERSWTFMNDAAEQLSGGHTKRSTPSRSSASRSPTPSITSSSQSSLANTDNSLQTVAAFWSIFLPHEDPALDGSIGGVSSAPWIPTVRAFAEGNSVVRIAFEACAFVGHGWMTDNTALVRRGLSLYGIALKQTNAALRDPDQLQTDEILACCRVLSLFEMLNRGQSEESDNNQVSNWRNHVDGTCRMIRLRGRERHITGHGLVLYDGVRMTAVIQGIAGRRANAFTSLPWQPPEYNMRDRLFNLASELPELLEQTNTFLDSTSQTHDESDTAQWARDGNELIQRGIALSNTLRAWETEILSMCQAAAQQQQQKSPQSSDGPFTVATNQGSNPSQLLDVCKLHGSGFFFICTQYWAISLHTYSSIRQCHRRLTALSHPTGAVITDLPGWINPEPHALNIAHVTPYFFREEGGLWAAQSAIFPVGAALFYFALTGRRESEVFRGMTGAFEHSKNGAVMRGFMRDAVRWIDMRTEGRQ